MYTLTHTFDPGAGMGEPSTDGPMTYRAAVERFYDTARWWEVDMADELGPGAVVKKSRERRGKSTVFTLNFEFPDQPNQRDTFLITPVSTA